MTQQIRKLASFEGLEPGLYETTVAGVVYTVAIGTTGVGVASRSVAADPPPGEWTTVEPLEVLLPEEDQLQILYGAQPQARSMRVRFNWTPQLDLSGEYEYEPFALVGMKGTGPFWKNLPLYFVLRNGNARFRTGVGVVMDDKATSAKKWRPASGATYSIVASVLRDGEAHLVIQNARDAWHWDIERPPEGRPGPWDFPLMLQLGGPKGKAAGHRFEDVSFQVK